MAEVMVINPRRRRRSRRRARVGARSHRRTARRRRRVHARVNPVRRLRRVGRRARRARGRVRRHRNPRLGSLMGVNITQAGGAALGIIGANLATSAVLNNIPGIPPALKTGPGRIAAKAVVGIGAGWVVSKLLKQHNLGRGIMVGGVIAAFLEAWAQYAQPHLPATLQDYELTGGVGVYELGEGGQDFNEEGITGFGSAENMYADSMY